MVMGGERCVDDGSGKKWNRVIERISLLLLFLYRTSAIFISIICSSSFKKAAVKQRRKT
jgi:hypothetical protein